MFVIDGQSTGHINLKGEGGGISRSHRYGAGGCSENSERRRKISLRQKLLCQT